MSKTRYRNRPSATSAGMLLGATVAALVLLGLAVALTREPDSAVKAFVAVWLAALPVLGLGALVGWLLTTALSTAMHGRATKGRC